MDIEQPSGEEIRVPCHVCEGETFHTVLVRVKDDAEMADSDEWIWERHEILCCGGCRSYSYRRAFRDTTDIEWDTQTGEERLRERATVYPRRVAGRRRLRRVWRLPRRVRSIYRETFDTVVLGHRVLPGIGIRALVEAVCRDQESPGRNLEQRIDGLVAGGVLTKEGAEILHGTRLLGNEAAHEAKPLKPDTLLAALDVVEYLLKGTYILPNIATTLPRRDPGEDGGENSDGVE